MNQEVEASVSMQTDSSAVLVELLPLLVGAAVVPVPIIIVLLLLGKPGGLLKAAAFLGGAIGVRLAQGIVFGAVFASDRAATSEIGGNLIFSTLLIVLGVMLWIAAFKKWAKEDDPDEPSPRWMTAVGGLSAPKAFGMGAALVALSAKQWVFTLSAITAICQARLDRPASIGLYLVFVLAAQAFGLVAALAYAVAPGPAGRALGRTEQWLERNNRPILVAVSLAFGLYFLVKGTASLAG
jgi:hypothetical protein